MFPRFNSKINDIKIKMAKARSLDDEERRLEIGKLNQEYYNLIFKKDVWIRKKMFQLKLYLAETEHDPRKSIYGG